VPIRREVLWILVLAVVGADLWWSGTPATFAWWWVPLIALNGVCLLGVLGPLIRGGR